MPPMRPLVLELSTIFGRIVAALREELHQPQAQRAALIGWDPGVLSRVESGRNTATIDHIVELGVTFTQAGLVDRPGDLLDLTERAVRSLQRRGHRAVYGVLPRPDEAPIEAPELDRIVAAVVDEWIAERRPTPKRPRTGRAR